jgi:hypothetical protein
MTAAADLLAESISIDVNTIHQGDTLVTSAMMGGNTIRTGNLSAVWINMGRLPTLLAVTLANPEWLPEL